MNWHRIVIRAVGCTVVLCVLLALLLLVDTAGTAIRWFATALFVPGMFLMNATTCGDIGVHGAGIPLSFAVSVTVYTGAFVVLFAAIDRWRVRTRRAANR